jgi:hypothetical protein
VKQLSDQMVARSGDNPGFEENWALLLSAGSTYDKTHATPRLGQRNFYTESFEQDDYVFDINMTMHMVLIHWRQILLPVQ